MNFEISHAVDDSDVAFVMRLDRKSTVCSMMSSRSTHYHKVGTNIDGFVNLATLNYLLAGLQLCYVPSHTEKSKWFELLFDLDQYQYPTIGTQLTLWDLRYITRELIVPFGVVRGSEKQGGQDETGLSAATWPVNFVCNMVLDGHERNILNYWHYHDISAGDDLVFRLKPMPIPKGKNAYTLNHYYKRFVQHNFESYFQQSLGCPFATHVWQLVPDVLTLDCKYENDETNGNPEIRMTPGFEVPDDYVWQEQGYWHIARSQVMVRKYAMKQYYNDDMANQLKVSHLDVTFEPTYSKMPGESRDPNSERTVGRDHRRPDSVVPVEAIQLFPIDRMNVAPGMMARPGGREWAPKLRLEELLGGSMPLLPGQEEARPSRSRVTLGSELVAICEADNHKRQRLDASQSGAARVDAFVAPLPRRAQGGASQPRQSQGGASQPRQSQGGASQPRQSQGGASQPRQSHAQPLQDPDVDAPSKSEPAGDEKVEHLDYGLTFSEPDAPPAQGAAADHAEPGVSFSSILSSIGGGRGGKKRKQAQAQQEQQT